MTLRRPFNASEPNVVSSSSSARASSTLSSEMVKTSIVLAKLSFSIVLHKERLCPSVWKTEKKKDGNGGESIHLVLYDYSSSALNGYMRQSVTFWHNNAQLLPLRGPAPCQSQHPSYGQARMCPCTRACLLAQNGALCFQWKKLISVKPTTLNLFNKIVNTDIKGITKAQRTTTLYINSNGTERKRKKEMSILYGPRYNSIGIRVTCDRGPWNRCLTCMCPMLYIKTNQPTWAAVLASCCCVNYFISMPQDDHSETV